MASLQQIVEQLALLATTGKDTNDTTSLDGMPTTSVPSKPIELVTSVIKTILSASALRDWAILLVIGSLFETARRLLSSLWSALINAFFITAVFEDDDVSFQWIMHWLSQQPSWKGARNVQISTSNFDLCAVEIDGDESDSSGHSRKVAYLPAVSESYTLWYKHRWMGVTRAVLSKQGGWSTSEVLTLSIMTRDPGILAEILQDARNEYIKAQEDKITIYVSSSTSDYWRELATRPKRPLNSIILDPGTAELVVDDVRDFLSSKEWYAERGIPFRRGFLLHGAPGSGKTSLIHSIAGELGLNVYIVSLSRSGLDDTSLADLIAALPERCIALMEDIDAALHHSLTRETSPASSETSSPDKEHAPPRCQVSLSGLLNALDGIGAQEGRVLFATTNKYKSLDPALCRPGRMDLHIEFKLASRFQAEELFKRFYTPSSSASAHGSKRKHRTASGKRENEHVDTAEDPLIDLSESQAPPAPFSSSSSSSSSPSPSSPSSPPNASLTATEKDEKNPCDRPASSGPTYVGVVHSGRAPTLSRDQINALAAQFALAVPERQLSMASLQGFLMMYKTRPFEAAANVQAWVEKELMEKRGAEKGENEQ